MYKVISSLKNELSSELPGVAAHQMLLPEGRLILDQGIKKVHASILILIYPDNTNQETIVLIKRPTYNGHHSGQVSFPGGKMETTDQSYEWTALRESEEEIGINALSVKTIGTLSDLYIPVSNFLVHPYIGYIEYTPDFTIDKTEVEYLIEYPLEKLIDLEIKTKLDFSVDKKRKIPYFEINSEIVWGATSMILNEFIFVLKKCRPNNNMY